MRLEASDPDLETLVARIERQDIDLQPEFQRGEVWSRAKKQRLVDSILRGWHVPPIHVIEIQGTRKQEVLDGQQRLTAIRDFVRGDFPIDGRIEPIEEDIAKLNGKKFRDIPEPWKRRFNQFTIRVFRIVDYLAEEPGELFFRLNQPTSLTAAEQRNAFFGPVRAQVKKLVELLSQHGIDKELLGFSNSRMAYDDIIARVALSVERNTLAEKVTANNLIELYRSSNPLHDSTIRRIEEAINLFSMARSTLVGNTQFNKATLYSWMIFVIRALSIDRTTFSSELLSQFLPEFESRRLYVDLDLVSDPHFSSKNDHAGLNARMFKIYADRSTARVADVSSVILRDATIWLELESFLRDRPSYRFPLDRAKIKISTVRSVIEKNLGSPFDADKVARDLVTLEWGTIL